MELGACVCTSSHPKCERCPVRQHCLAYTHLQQYVAGGGAIMSETAPLVTRYPTKVPVPAACPIALLHDRAALPLKLASFQKLRPNLLHSAKVHVGGGASHVECDASNLTDLNSFCCMQNTS